MKVSKITCEQVKVTHNEYVNAESINFNKILFSFHNPCSFDIFYIKITCNQVKMTHNGYIKVYKNYSFTYYFLIFLF